MFQIKTFSAPDFRHGPVPKTCCRKFQTENVLFPAAQETEKFSKPKKGKKKIVNPAAQATALSRKLVFFANRNTQKNMQFLDKIHTVFTATLR